MSRLPRLSGKEVIKILSKVGFIIARQRGSHVIMKKLIENKEIALVVPNHKEIDTGTLIEIIRQARMKRD